MTDPAPFDDDGIVDDLRRLAAEVDPVPDEVRESARAAIGMRDLDRALARLVADSATGSAFEQVRTGTTGVPGRRLLSFADGEVQVDLEVTEHGDRVDLIGHFTGASTEDCVLEYADGMRHPLDVDSLGRFLLDDARRGTVRARFRSASGTAMTTAWVTI